MAVTVCQWEQPNTFKLFTPSLNLQKYYGFLPVLFSWIVLFYFILLLLRQGLTYVAPAALVLIKSGSLKLIAIVLSQALECWDHKYAPQPVLCSVSCHSLQKETENRPKRVSWRRLSLKEEKATVRVKNVPVNQDSMCQDPAGEELRAVFWDL